MQFDRCFRCMGPTNTYPCPHCGYDLSKKAPLSYVLQPGVILNGKYVVGDVLGQGGFGITYVGWDLALDCKVAIKEYFPSGQASRFPGDGGTLQWYNTQQAEEAYSNGREMFLKEARKMSRVSNIPQVVRVRDLFQQNETAYIVMDFVEGETLKSRLSRTGPMSWQEAKAIFLPAVQAMEQVHSAGLIHRDLSPDNLMLQPDGTVRILDLGAAKDLNTNSGASSMQVAKGGFSPLEQYTQRGGSGTWTDVYAMAATLYYSLTGVLPPAAVDRVEEDPIRWDLPTLTALPKHVLMAMQKAMVVSAKKRTQTMGEFFQQLEDKGSPQKKTQPAPKPPKPDKNDGAAKKKGRKLAIFALAAVLLAAIAGAGWYVWGKMVDKPWEHNVLMADPIPKEYLYQEGQAPVLGSDIMRIQIRSVTVLDSLADAPWDAWDVSEARDGSVKAWVTRIEGGEPLYAWIDGKRVVEGFDLFLGAEGGINAKYCKELFRSYGNLRSFVVENDSFHTDYATSMEHMFSYCRLTVLEPGAWNTSRVESTEYMFVSCDFETLTLTMDTSNVKSMRGMFEYCSDLTDLKVSGFDVSNVEDYDKFMGSGKMVNGKPWKNLFG